MHKLITSLLGTSKALVRGRDECQYMYNIGTIKQQFSIFRSPNPYFYQQMHDNTIFYRLSLFYVSNMFLAGNWCKTEAEVI